jgi:hypothetical protein
MIKKTLLLAIILALSLALFPAHATPTYTPHQGDTFSYYEVADVGSGTGLNYSGYTDHTVTTGMERMNGVFVNGTVAANYTYTWTFNDNQGSPTKTGKSSGNFTWSSTSFLYVKRTDNQTGYVSPTVWFYMDNSLPQSGTFYLLNTPMTVTSTSYSYHLASQNSNVNTIRATGTSSYHRDDLYGVFNAAYTWTTYFDPSTGYIVGYDYSEQDTNSTTGNGFTYTDSLYVTSTSYTLTATSFLQQYLGLIVGLVIFFIFIVIIIVVIVAISRRRRSLPRHPYPQVPVAPPQIDLTPKQPPVQQIVIKEIVKVKCQYCGALIDSTVKACPFCGAPRT